MPQHVTSGRTTLAFSALLFLCGGLAPTGAGSARALTPPPAAATAQGKCAATTDAEIVAAVQEKIKADKRFDDQWRHINVSSRDRVVTLAGWAKGRVQVSDLIKLARTTACVRRVVSKLNPHMTVGCGPGQRPCGDTCIAKTDTCNLIQ
ncbi:MAG TPA: BON domain-containing protein [Pyrinomonadaceae bacterium]|jgi:osmotically-inducible protein OsmY